MTEDDTDASKHVAEFNVVNNVDLRICCAFVALDNRISLSSVVPCMYLCM